MAATAEHSRRRRSHVALSTGVASLLAIAASTLSIVAGGVTDEAGQLDVDTRIAKAWQVLRVVDCARCHGKDYAGLAAPSIVDYVAVQDYETFVRMILDGDPIRGMPGYRSNTYVVENIDDIYRYFRARASGEVGREYRPRPAEQRGK